MFDEVHLLFLSLREEGGLPRGIKRGDIPRG
jgi:hypothetical protein